MKTKQEYFTPHIEQIRLDHEISLVLQSDQPDDSNPPIFEEGIGQMRNPELFINNPMNQKV